MGISIWHLLLVRGIVVLLFGTKKLRNIGGDLGGAIRGFKKSMNDDDKPEDPDSLEGNANEQSQQAPEEKSKDKTKG